MAHYYLREGRVRTLKDGVNPSDYEAVHPEAIKVTKPPTIGNMEKWMETGIAKATDGCKVEPDGECPHGHKSWISQLGYI